VSVRRASALAVAVLAVVPAAALGGDGHGVPRSALLWATINVCDTVGHPDGVGIRGSMPGTGDRKESMWMRFELQSLDPDGRWADLPAGGDSGFLEVGSARYRVRLTGRTFTVTPPAAGGVHTLRGIVTFEWREGDVVVRRAIRRTRSGHPRTAGADPPGYSAAFCSVR